MGPTAARAAVEALTELGLRGRLPVEPLDFADPDVRRSWVRDRGLQVFMLRDADDPTRQVDVFATPPVPWAELVDDAVEVELAGRTVRIASLRHLIQMKLAAGRPQDQRDVEALRALHEICGARTTTFDYDSMA